MFVLIVQTISNKDDLLQTAPKYCKFWQEEDPDLWMSLNLQYECLERVVILKSEVKLKFININNEFKQIINQIS